MENHKLVILIDINLTLLSHLQITKNTHNLS